MDIDTTQEDLEIEDSAVAVSAHEGCGLVGPGSSDTVMAALPSDSMNSFPSFPLNSIAHEIEQSLLPPSTIAYLPETHETLRAPLLNSRPFDRSVLEDDSDSSSVMLDNNNSQSFIDPISPLNPPANRNSDSESDLDSSDSEKGDCDDDNDENTVDHEAVYKELEILINKHIKRLRDKKVMMVDTSAPSKVIELEALRRYTKARVELQRKFHAQKQKIASAPPHLRPVLHKQIPTRWSKSAKTASLEVAECLGKGPYYARRLRTSANHLLKTGLILETKQGQGATHASLLNRLDVRESVLKWARGQVSEEDGGFKGRVS